MEKYIDADKVKAEIERLKNNSELAKMEWINEGYNQNAFAEDCRIVSFDALLSFLDTLSEEEPDTDLEKEIEKEWEKLEKDYSPSALDKSHIIVSGLVGRKQFSRIAHHFYELCKNSK